MGSKLHLAQAQGHAAFTKLADQAKVRTLIDRLRGHPVRLGERKAIYGWQCIYKKIM